MKWQTGLNLAISGLLLALVSGGATGAEPDRARPDGAKPNHADRAENSFNHLFELRNVEGWTVYVNKKDLAEHPAEMAATLEHLQQQLYQVRLNVPAPAVAIMQQRVPIWFEYDTIGIAYHGRGWLVANGYRPPDVETLVGFCRARTFLDNALHQPSVVFHELAHGYDHRYLRRPNPPGNLPVKNAYDKAMAAGKYDSVLCRYSKAAKAYGANNPGEFFSENSEAFFGVNDFYPFVRAELREYDPDMYRALVVQWGVDMADLQRRERSLVALMQSTPSPQGWATDPVKEEPSVSGNTPTSAYQERRIEGWTVHVAPSLLKRRAYCDEACKLLRHKLHLVTRYVPERALVTLQQVPIWLEEDNPAVPYVAYHGDKKALQQRGLPGEKYQGVEIGNTANFRRWQDLQPSIVLHHLALAYLDRLDATDRQAVADAFEKAAGGEKYDRVLRFDGRHVRHPALLNAGEYFAQMSTSYYGFNDHYPFLQFELSQHDPAVCKLLARLWGGKAK